LTFARRPLNAQELQHALAVRPEETDSTSSLCKFFPHEEPRVSLDRIVDRSAGLIVVNNVSNIISLAHPTVQKYLTNQKNKFFPNVDVYLAKACVTYLRLKELKWAAYDTREKIDALLKAFPFLDYAALSWMWHSKDINDPAVP
jgi:hypothetical protein